MPRPPRPRPSVSRSVLVLATLPALAPAGARAETIVDSDIVAHTTWNSGGSPYRVTATITVRNNAMLTIQAGTTVLFEPATSLQIAIPDGFGYYARGRLEAQGSQSSPVLFDAANGQSGSWSGLYFALESGAYGPSLMTWCEVRNAGADNLKGIGAALQCWDTSSPTLTNVTVAESSGFGLHAHQGDGVTLQDCSFQDNDVAIVFNTPGSAPPSVSRTSFDGHRIGIETQQGVAAVISDCDFTTATDSHVLFQSTGAGQISGSTFDASLAAPIQAGYYCSISGNTFAPSAGEIAIQPGNITASHTWDDPGTNAFYGVRGGDLVLNNLAVLTLDPGVEIRMDEVSGLVVGNYWRTGWYDMGSLWAVGTVQDPIVFDAISDSTQGWPGLYFGDVTDLSLESNLKHCTIRNAGAPNWDGARAALHAEATVEPNLDAVIFESSTKGLLLEGGAALAPLGCTFSGNQTGIATADSASNAAATSCTFEDNDLGVSLGALTLAALDSCTFLEPAAGGENLRAADLLTAECRITSCSFQQADSIACTPGYAAVLADNVFLPGRGFIEMPPGSVGIDVVWTDPGENGHYLVSGGDLVVLNRATLELQAGVRVVFDPGSGLVIGNYWQGGFYEQGLLEVRGTRLAPVVLESLSGLSGGWRGLYFGDASDVFGGRSHLDWCQIRHAGANNWAGWSASLVTEDTQAPILRNCTLEEGTGHGLVSLGTGGAALDSCQVSTHQGYEVRVDRGRPVLSDCSLSTAASKPVVWCADPNDSAIEMRRCGASGSGTFAVVAGFDSRVDELSVSGYGTSAVELPGAGLTQDAALGGIPAPGAATFRVTGADIVVWQGATLTIRAGTTLEFADGRGLVIANYNYGGPTNNGSLACQGGADSLIVLRGAEGAAWPGLFFGQMSDYGGAFSTLRWTRIEDAGGVSNTRGYQAALHATDTGTPLLEDCVLTGAANYGVVCEGSAALDLRRTSFDTSNDTELLVLDAAAATPSVENCIFTGDGGHAVAIRSGYGASLTGNTFSGYTRPIELPAGTSDRLLRLSEPTSAGASYTVTGGILRLEGSDPATTGVELGAAVELRFESGGGLEIGAPAGLSGVGSLRLPGPPDSLAWLHGSSSAPGFWRGLTVGLGSTLEGPGGLLVEDAGAPGFASAQAGILFLSALDDTLAAAVVRGSDGAGITVASGSLHLARATLTDNVDGLGVSEDGALSVAAGGEIYGNSRYGVVSDADTTLSMEGLWWGDASGPYHA